MPFRLEPGQLAFDADGTPFSPVYGDIYHNAAVESGGDPGLGQARHVFIAGNGLPLRWAGAAQFTIVECGFGLGLNFLAAWQTWRDDPQRCERLHFVSVEKHPFTREDLHALHDQHPALAPLAVLLREAWPPLVPGMHRLEFDGGRVSLTIAFADVADAVAEFRFGADAFCLDGFAPDRNPDMWTPQLMQGLARLARPGATLATYTTARAVRDALAAAGFANEKNSGYPPKRDMLAARFSPRWAPRRTPPDVPLWPERRAIVIGAGLAGAAVCERLSARGWQIELIERNNAPAGEASGLHAGIFHPHPSADDNLLSRLTRAGFLYALQRWRALEAAGQALRRQCCGVLRIAQDADEEQRLQATLQTLAYPESYAAWLPREAASRHANCGLARGGWWFPDGGWVKPASLVAAQLAATARLVAHYGVAVNALQCAGDGWLALDGDGRVIASAPVVVLANSHDAARLADFAQPLASLRGQVTYVPASGLPRLRTVLLGDGYVTPDIDGIAITGATSDFADAETLPRDTDHARNLSALEEMLPGSAAGFDPGKVNGAVDFRCAAPDRLPLIGAVPDVENATAQSAALTGAHAADIPRLPGLYAACAYGSRGLVWAALAGELIADLVSGAPPLLEKSLVDAIDPARFVLKRVRRGEL